MNDLSRLRIEYADRQRRLALEDRTRRLAHISWMLCLFLESLKIFNTHYLVLIRPSD